jgi:predicted  nucleic acid-binding Zn-ribbon protein
MFNRAETRLSTLQLLKIQLGEREAETKRKIAQIDENLRPETVDRTLSGTLDAVEARAARRRALENERNDLSRLLGEIQNSLYDTETEIAQTQLFLRRIRQQIFSEVERELSEL